MPRNYWTPARIAQFEAMDAKNKAKHKHDAYEVTAEEQKERNALKSRRYYMFKKGGQLETIRAKLAEFGLEVVRLEDIREDESTPPPSPDGSKRSDHPTSTRSAEKHVDKAPRQKPVFARARSLFGTGDVHESNAMPDGVSCLRDAGPYTSSPYLEGLGNRIVKMDAIGFLMHVVEAHAKKCPESCIRLCNGFKCGEPWQFQIVCTACDTPICKNWLTLPDKISALCENGTRHMRLWEGNVAAVAGTMANGDGYRHYLRSRGWCNLPWMSKVSFKRLKILWGEGLLRESAKSRARWQKREREIAEERSSYIDVKGTKYPAVWLIVDGGASTTDHANMKGRAMAVCVPAIGAFTHKVVDCEVVQKYCHTCHEAKKHGRIVEADDHPFNWFMFSECGRAPLSKIFRRQGSGVYLRPCKGVVGGGSGGTHR